MAAATTLVTTVVAEQQQDPLSKIRFLQGLSARFEADGNFTEAVKSDETALLLFKATVNTKNAAQVAELSKIAQNLVNRCNAIAVQEFQNLRFDTASFLLNKALFLTEEFSDANCFLHTDHDRLRLRAATYNNFGCMEKRKGKLPAALECLQRAAQLEVLVDPDTGAAPTTNLNLCAVLNKMGQHVQAVLAAERAVNSLRFQSLQGHENFPQFAQMLLTAYYNLAVSLECAARQGDIAASIDAYTQVVDIARRHGFDTPSNKTVTAAKEALQKLQQMYHPTVLPRLVSTAPAQASAVGPQDPPAPVRVVVRSQQQGHTTPRPPSVANSAEIQRPATGSKMDSAAARHAERIQARQRKKAELAQRDQIALERAQRAHVRQKEDKLKREQEAEAQRREEMAKALYDKMVNGLRTEEIKRVRLSARKIQKVWRGHLARSLIARMQAAALTLQACVRAYLCRRRISRQKEEEESRALAEKNMQRQAASYIKIQRFFRRCLARLAIIRNYKAKVMRRVFSVRKIQRFFRSYLANREVRIQRQLELERIKDEHAQKRVEDAARKIQQGFRKYKQMQLQKLALKAQVLRHKAATKIQALVRGMLTRIWFKHFRQYRRQQEFCNAKNIACVTKLQTMWRVVLARRKLADLRTEYFLKQRKLRANASALKIQCFYRVCKARQTVRPLRLRQELRKRAAMVILTAFRTYKLKNAYKLRRDARRRDRAARLIQVWYRERVITNKHRETARYYGQLRRMNRLALLRTDAALKTQAALTARLSSLIVESVRQSYNRQTRFALTVQKVGRGRYARKDMAVLQRCAFLTDQEKAEQDRRNNAARVIQRAVRVFLAKTKTANRRRQKIASVIIQKNWRMHVAVKELQELRNVRDDKRRNQAAIAIQKVSRRFLRNLELKRLDAYYQEKHRLQIQQLRREEAATTVQAVWRGYCTRKMTTLERNAMLQRTMDCMRIQRAYRAHLFRVRLEANIMKSQLRAKKRRDAAVKLQSFWRKVLASEYVAVLREKRFTGTVCALSIQCAWRSYLARKTFRARKAARLAEQMHKASLHDIWVRALLVVSASLREKSSGKLVVERKTKALRAELAEKEREKFIREYRAATKIQAVYRGYYERFYARALRKEREEKERAEKVLRDKRNRAALRIQSAVRSAWARAETAKRREAKRMALIQLELERATCADPHDIVRQMFWAHEAAVKRDLTKDRIHRHAETTRSAVLIQKMARQFLAVRKYRRMIAQKEAEAAAAAIQERWRLHEEQRLKALSQKRHAAAVTIQSLVRGALTRKKWEIRRTQMGQLRANSVSALDRRDKAAIRIQSMWRRYAAQCRADSIRQQRLAAKRLQERTEAAKLIQSRFRGYHVRCNMDRIRSERMALKKTKLSRPATGDSVSTPDGLAAAVTAPAAAVTAPAAAAVSVSSSSSQGGGVIAPRRPSEEAPPRPPPRRLSAGPTA